MHSLRVVEFVPLFIGQLIGISAVAHVRIPALFSVPACCALVLLTKMLPHKLFREDLVSQYAREDEPDEQHLKSEEDAHQQDVSIVWRERKGECTCC